MRETIYIYHHGDADGIGAAAMIDLAYPSAKKTFISSDYPVTIDTTPFQFLTDPATVTVFIVDLSLNEEGLTQLLQGDLPKLVNKIVWIDHHETSTKSIQKNKIPYPDNLEVVVNTDACGALLTYQYLHPDYTPPVFLQYIDYHDRHVGTKKQVRNATNLDLMIMSVKKLNPTSDIWRELLAGGEIKLENIIAIGEFIHEYLDTVNARLIASKGVVTKIFGIECIAVNAQGTSILFNSVEDEFPLRLAWYYDGQQYKYSLYSDGSINCRELAAKFGGGGHPGAAGFTSDQLLFIDKVHKRYSPK